MSAISCSTIVRDPQRILVDIRPLEERWLVGFIPGSVDMDSEDEIDRLGESSRLALVCTSGVRARAMAERHPIGAIDYLEGGILAWGEAGKPLASAQRSLKADGDTIRFRDLAQAYDGLKSCFLAELIQSDLSEIESGHLEPIALFHQAAERAGVTSSPGAHELLRLMDHMARVRLCLGADVERIADNLSLFGRWIFEAGHVEAPVSAPPSAVESHQW